MQKGCKQQLRDLGRTSSILARKEALKQTANILKEALPRFRGHDLAGFGGMTSDSSKGLFLGFRAPEAVSDEAL